MSERINPQTQPAAARARLVEIVRTRSFRSGEAFKLASGRVSSIYFNLKPTMLQAEGAYLIASLVLDALAHDDIVQVGGLELGAVPIAAAVAAVSQQQNRSVAAFLVRKQAKEHGTQSLIEGLMTGESLAGQRCAVLEDVTTTGGSALKAVEAVRAAGGTVARVVTVLDREEGADAVFAAAGLPFTALLTVRDFVP